MKRLTKKELEKNVSELIVTMHTLNEPIMDMTVDVAGYIDTVSQLLADNCNPNALENVHEMMRRAVLKSPTLKQISKLMEEAQREFAKRKP